MKKDIKKFIKKNKQDVITCVGLFLIAIIYTIMVTKTDVRAIGPEFSKVGFSNLNSRFSDLIGSNMVIYKITEVLGYLAILIAVGYALLGLYELIKRKSIKKIDKEIIGLGVLYVFVAILYVFFEKVIINYRPILIDGVLEASFPSSHTLLAICVCGSAMMINKSLFKRKPVARYVSYISLVLIVLIPFGRLMSGVHWLTDIVGGILYSVAILSTYKVFLQYCKKEK